MGKLIAILTFTSFLGLIAGSVISCQTPALERFPQVHDGMTKDEVLELLGSPKRTEYKDGKEKWAYKFYKSPESNEEELRFVTFSNGKVIASGDDLAERKRLNDIVEADKRRAEKRKNHEAGAKSDSANTGAEPINMAPVVAPPSALKVETVTDEESKPAGQPGEFKEMKGKRGPTVPDNYN